MTSWPINWRTGGIGWHCFNGVFSLYVCPRFGLPDGSRRPIGVVLRIGKRERALFSARKRKWLFGRIQVRVYA